MGFEDRWEHLTGFERISLAWLYISVSGHVKNLALPRERSDPIVLENNCERSQKPVSLTQVEC